MVVHMDTRTISSSIAGTEAGTEAAIPAVARKTSRETTISESIWIAKTSCIWVKATMEVMASMGYSSHSNASRCYTHSIS